MSKVSQSDYRALSAFRHEIRRFLAFSEQAARSADIEPQQHQLLLAVQGLPANVHPTIGVIAERLCVQHHTAVALVDKLEERQLLLRERSGEDRREVLLRLTDAGAVKLRALSELHRDHLRRVGPNMLTSLATILGKLQLSTDSLSPVETEASEPERAKKRAAVRRPQP